jgi:hypothetical protein
MSQILKLVSNPGGMEGAVQRQQGTTALNIEELTHYPSLRLAYINGDVMELSSNLHKPRLEF